MRLRALLPALLLAAATASAQIDSISGASGAPPAGPLVTLQGAVQGRTGDDVQGTITAHILDGWHINSNKPLDEYAIPTVLSLDPATAELTGAQYPPHIVRTFAFSGDNKVAVYEGTIRIPFTAKLKPNAKAIRATLNYQACNDRVCLPPKKAEVEFLAVASGAAAPAAAPTAGSTTFTPLTAAPKNATPAPPPDRLAATFASHGLPLTLLILFIGGLALNLTPCVFPLIPITMGFFAMQSDGRRSRRFALSLSYVLGIVITYSALGVFAALSGRMFGAWLQSPAVLIAFAALMLVLASSMFGLWEFRVPRFIADRSGGRAGAAGALTMGLFVGVVAAPCVGPVVVALFTLVAAIGKPVIGIAMFATLAFGLGFPYLVALNALPKPGEWMVQVKKAMGFVLIAMAFYFLRALVGEEIFRYGVAASLLIGAAFLFFVRGARGRTMRLACAILLLVSGVAFALPRKESTLRWDRYSEKTLAAAAAAGKPVVIDFYADWCIPCKELDEKTFSDPKVAAEMDRFVRVKADLTAGESQTTQLLTKQYGIVGVPTIVFLDPSGREQTDLRLFGFEPAERFLERTRRAGR